MLVKEKVAVVTVLLPIPRQAHPHIHIHIHMHILPKLSHTELVQADEERLYTPASEGDAGTGRRGERGMITEKRV